MTYFKNSDSESQPSKKQQESSLQFSGQSFQQQKFGKALTEASGPL